MKLAELIIENFRGIGHEPVRIKIDNIIVLIGKNNVGKTTILSAYEAFASTGAALDLKDYYCENADRVPKITGVFVDVTDEEFAPKWIHDDEELGYTNCIKAQYQWPKPGEKGIKFSFNPETGAFETGGLGGLDAILTNRIPKPIKISPLDDPADLEKKTLEILTEAIKDNVKKDNDRLNTLFAEIEKLASDVQTEIQEQIESSTTMIAAEIKKVFPEHTTVKIDAKSGKIEPEKIISSGSTIRIGNENSHLAPLANHGTGLQRTFLWAALKMLAETGRHKIERKKVDAGTPKILLIEEPEAFLHPSAIKSARESLYAVAELADWQIMTSTHSPNLIDVTKDHTTIIRIEKTGTEQHLVKTFSTDQANFGQEDRENLKMLNLCNPYFNEFFFANQNILVEGETEHTVIQALLEQHDLPEKDGIHVINCFGKANIVTVSKILNHFKVGYSIIHDADNPKNKRRDKYIRNGMWTENRKIDRIANEGRAQGLTVNTFVSVPNFEGAYLDGNKSTSKPYGAWRYFTSTQDENTQRFLDILNFVTGKNKTTAASDYSGYGELVQRVEDYVRANNLEADPLWSLEGVHDQEDPLETEE